MMHAWLSSLNEDQIATWANKGLLRRGKKTLANCEPESWQLQADQASADIDGHQQQLNGVGFDALSCNCAAFGPCHHLVSFVLGLQTRASQHNTEAADTSDDTVSEALPEPWLDGDVDGLESVLGKANIGKALRWLAWGYQAELEYRDDELIVSLDADQEVQLRIPRYGGLAASVCSCKASRCYHRALVVIQTRQQAGLAIPELAIRLLGEQESRRVQQVQHWLTALILQGNSSTGPAFIDQGEVLATELRQCDLPRPAKALQALVELLRQQQQRSHDTRQHIADRLANIWILLRGLQQHPTPRPWVELAGEHRQHYRHQRNRTVQAEAVEVWETLSGYRGFTLHLRDCHSGHYLSWSQARSQEQDVGWEPRSAWRDARLAEIPVQQLLKAPHRLISGWISREGRLSGREGTQLRRLDEPLSYPIRDKMELLQQRQQSLLSDPWRKPENTLAWLDIAHYDTIEQDKHQRLWRLDTRDSQGQSVILQGTIDRYGRKALDRMQARLLRHETIHAVFGSIWVEQGQLFIRPISILSGDNKTLVHLTL
jgi:hypothetical protein